MRYLARLRLVLIIALTLAGGALAVMNAMDNRVLYAWSLQWIEPGEAPSVALPKLLDGFRTLSWGDGSDEDVGMFRSLGLTPREVLEKGGPCESKSRLLRSLLHLHGIRSGRVLLRDGGRGLMHTVTEVELEDGTRTVVDPLYGLYFPRPGGGFYTLDELRRDPDLVCQRVAALRELDPPPTPPYSDLLASYCESLSPFYSHPSFGMTWKERSPLRSIALRTASLLMGPEWLESTPRPYLMERPTLMVLALVLFADVFLLATMLPGLLRKRLARA